MRSSLRPFDFLGIAVLGTWFLAVGPLASAESFVIRGTVRDTSRNILPDVKVSLTGSRAATNDEGRFIITLQERPKGTINFDKPGYGERHIALPEGDQPMEVSLTPNQNNAGLILERTRISNSHSLTTVRQLEPALLRRPLTMAVYREFVDRHGEAPTEEVIIRIYLPEKARVWPAFS